VFDNLIRFVKEKSDTYYYYSIAKDFETSFVDLNVLSIPIDSTDKPVKLSFEQVHDLPLEFLKNNQTANMMDNVIMFKIKLNSDDDVQKISVKEYHKGRMEPYPKVIRVYEQQKVEVFDSKYYLSLYPTQECTCVYYVRGNDVHYKSQEPSDEYDDRVQYGPYKNVKPLTFDHIQLMFTFKFPLPTFTEAKRDIYVSHWGNIAVDEYFNIHNDAAGINGQFSRVDYQPHINPNHGANAITTIGTELPSYIHGLYYYDYIGNISTSHAKREENHVEFEIEFRFPLFGQWKTDWNQGYNMPSQYHLYKDMSNDQLHTLEIPFMHAYDDSLTEDYQFKVILPEGATDIQIELPSGLKDNVDSIEMGKFFGTLDFLGRPMITVNKKNAVYELVDDIVRVKYTFNNSSDFYLEPAYVFAMVFSLYLVAMFYSRMGLSLENKKVGGAQ